MEWRDEGVIMGVRRHGESSAIVEAMTAAHGRHLGLVRAGRSSRNAATLQPGNSVMLSWRARLDEHLGQFTLEVTTFRAARLIERAASLHGLTWLAHLLRLLPERDPHEGLYRAACVVLDHLDKPQVAAVLLVRFELELLAELGFGLDLTQCAATGATQELVYVSPKSGRAVSARAGAPYADKLLALPAFIKDMPGTDAVACDDLRAGLALTGFFLNRHVHEPRGLRLPDERVAFVAALAGSGVRSDGSRPA